MDEQSTHQLQGETESADSTRRGGFGWCFWASIFLPVYLLSIGPAERLIRNGILPESFSTVYGPITTLRWYSKPAQKFYNWYIELWCPHIPGTLAKQPPAVKSSSFPGAAKRPDASGFPSVKSSVLG